MIRINNKFVEENLDYLELINKLNNTFRSYYNGGSHMPSKVYMNINKSNSSDNINGDFRAMPARVLTKNIDLSGMKWVCVFPNNNEKGLDTVMGTVIINDPETGERLAVIDAEHLTGMRTGAVAGMATDLLSKEDSEVFGVVGLGEQAYHQYRSIKEVRNINKVIGIDISEERQNNFESNINNNVITTEDYSMLKECDIISTVTPVEKPIIKEEYVSEDAHINAMGADSPSKQELFKDLIYNSKIIVDDIDQASHSGEISKTYEDDNSIIDYSLGELISKEKDLKDNRSIFDSTGLAIQDITASHLIYEKYK